MIYLGVFKVKFLFEFKLSLVTGLPIQLNGIEKDRKSLQFAVKLNLY